MSMLHDPSRQKSSAYGGENREASSPSTTTLGSLQECLALSGFVDQEKVLQEAGQVLEHAMASVVPSSNEVQTSLSPSSTSVNTNRLSQLALETAMQMCQIGSDPSRKRKQSWNDLQSFSQRLLYDGTTGLSPTKAGILQGNALAISVVFGALAWKSPSTAASIEPTDIILPEAAAKAAASALATTVVRVASQDPDTPQGNTFIGRGAAGQMLRAYLLHETEVTMGKVSGTWNWNILTQFTRAFELSEHEGADIGPLVAEVVHEELQRVHQMEISGDIATALEERKQIVSGILALVCQVRPWAHCAFPSTTKNQDLRSLILYPIDLVKVAIPLDYWHAAELVCKSANDALRSKTPGTEAAAPPPVIQAVEYLIDSAMDERTYRRADNLATELYTLGGRSRYAQARFQHACDTISKVVFKRQYPIVERQVNRVDKAIERFREDSTNSEDASTIDSDFDPSQGIRTFALRRLEEAGQHDAAYRLAKLWKLDYVYDEQAMKEAAEVRRQSFLQFDEVLAGHIPNLISTANDLRATFQSFWKGGPYPQGPFGLDAEWEEDSQGVDLLQLSHPKQAILIDIPALVSSLEGVAALKETVGALLDSSETVVVGFACRQDLKRLRHTASVMPEGSSSWFPGTQSRDLAIVDLQPLVVQNEPQLAAVSSHVGLTRVCRHYLGKSLDKSEQCSFWGARPLSEGQRAYAALDAWACAAVYEKLHPLPANTEKP